MALEIVDPGIATPAPLPPVTALIRQIDADTDAIYRAVQGDRATEYAQAEIEAEAFKAASYEGDAPPSVASWAAAKHETAQWAADNILLTAAQWRGAQAAIRANRLARKEDARSGADLTAVAQQWSTFVTSIRASLGVPL